MNGGLTECDVCGCDSCVCKMIKARKDRETKATDLLKDFDAYTNDLYSALMKPKGIRLRLLKWLYPEIVKVSDSLRKCYWCE